MFSLEMSKLFALLNTASRVKSRRAVLSMTHRLTLPYSLDDGAMSILGEHFLADGRMDDGGRFISSPLHSSPFAQSTPHILNFKLPVEMSTQPQALQDCFLQP